MRERPRVLKTSTDAPSDPERPMRAALYALLGLLGIFAALQLWWVTTSAPGVANGPRILEVHPHLGLLGIARRLDEAGVIRSPFGFALLALVHGSARSLKAGEYEVPQGSNTFAVLSLLEGGKVLKHTVLLREGSTLAELAHAQKNAEACRMHAAQARTLFIRLRVPRYVERTERLAAGWGVSLTAEDSGPRA